MHLASAATNGNAATEEKRGSAGVSGEIVLGIGCRPETPAEEARRIVAALAALPFRPVRIATIDSRRSAPVVEALAAALGLPLDVHDAARLETMTPRLASPSEAVFRAIGCHGVAEAAALSSAGPAAVLLLPKTILGDVTLALAGPSRD